MLQLLIDAINKNYKEEHYCQFASHLLIMTLGFLTRMIKSQTLLEEHVAETMAGQQDTPREGKDVFYFNSSINTAFVFACFSGGTNPAFGTSKYSNTACLHMLVI